MARGHRPRDRYKSKLERKHAANLGLRKAAGEILDWKYEPIRIRLADNTFYTIDFLLLMADETIEAHEVKGWHPNIRDSRTRWKMAAEVLPWFRWRFITQPRGGGRWEIETYGESRGSGTRKPVRDSTL